MSRLSTLVRAAEDQYALARREAGREAGELVRLEALEADVLEAQDVLQTVAKAVQDRVHKQIADVVNSCLRTVFTDPEEFRVVFDKKRGRTEARLCFFRDGAEVDKDDGLSGGVQDVASFALRMACLVLRRPKPRLLLVLDEPFKNVHGDGNRERAAGLLLSLSREFGLQVIMTTGFDWLKIGKVVELKSGAGSHRPASKTRRGRRGPSGPGPSAGAGAGGR